MPSGPNLRALVIYLVVFQHVPVEANAIRNDPGAKRTERLNCRLKCPANIAGYRGIAEVNAAADPDPVELSRPRIEAQRRQRQTGSIAQVMPCNDFQ